MTFQTREVAGLPVARQTAAILTSGMALKGAGSFLGFTSDIRAGAWRVIGRQG